MDNILGNDYWEDIFMTIWKKDYDKAASREEFFERVDKHCKMLAKDDFTHYLFCRNRWEKVYLSILGIDSTTLFNFFTTISNTYNSCLKHEYYYNECSLFIDDFEVFTRPLQKYNSMQHDIVAIFNILYDIRMFEEDTNEKKLLNIKIDDLFKKYVGAVECVAGYKNILKSDLYKLINEHFKSFNNL